MKKNIVLFGIFILLLGATYFFQEKRVEREHTEESAAYQVFKTEITELKLPHVEAIKKDGSWWDGKTLLSHNTFKQIEKKLSEIHKVKDIQGKWEAYFTHPISFEVNGKKWALGDQSLDKQTFYLSKDKKIMLAEIIGESVHLTQNAAEIPTIKLNEFISAISKPLSELKETQLFRFYPTLSAERVIISSEGSLPFELDFANNETHPGPIKGISVHSQLRAKFTSLLTQMIIREEVPFDPKLKFKKMGEIQFKNSKEKVTWELWIKNKKSADAYIIDNENKRAFLMVGGTLKVFFIQLQDYWDKKSIPIKDFVSFERLDTEFIEGSKSARVTVLNREPLAFEVKGFKVDQLKMEELFQFIFNLGHRDQGDRVSNLSKTERQQILSEEHLRISVMGQELILWRKSQELIVANLTQGFKVHFHLVDENFRGTFEDVLK